MRVDVPTATSRGGRARAAGHALVSPPVAAATVIVGYFVILRKKLEAPTQAGNVEEIVAARECPLKASDVDT